MRKPYDTDGIHHVFLLARFEGFFGIIGTLFIMAPICYHLSGTEGEGIHEDIIDTLAVMINDYEQRPIPLSAS